jgi:hypothetical protein
MEDTTRAVLAERYGRFASHALITQSLRAVFAGDFDLAREFLSGGYAGRETCVLQSVRDKALIMQADQREALDMIAHKIGRILNGDPDYSDSWRDIAGYATLVADRLDGKDEATS